MKIPSILKINILIILVSMFSHVALCQEKESIVKQFELPNGIGTLMLTSTETEVRSTFKEKDYTQIGTVIRLYKEGAKSSEEAANKKTLMWENFFPSIVRKRSPWIADIYFDGTTKKSYLALSDGNSFWAKIVDWDGAVKRVQQNMLIVKIERKTEELIQKPYQLLRPGSYRAGELYIDNIKIRHIDQSINIVLEDKQGQKEEWVFSLETGLWNEANKTKVATLYETKVAETNGFFSLKNELSLPQPFIPSEKRGYWEYGKSRPGVRIEGDGIFVYRRPLPASATQEEDDAELQRQGKAPAYEYEFSVHYITPDAEMFSRVMWNLRVENPTRTPVDFSVYDTTFDRAADVMVVLFRLNGIVRANLLRGPDNGLLWADTKLDLTADEISRLTKAHIEGGPDENSLRLILEIKDAPALTFAFQNKKWVKLV